MDGALNALNKPTVLKVDLTMDLTVDCSVGQTVDDTVDRADGLIKINFPSCFYAGRIGLKTRSRKCEILQWMLKWALQGAAKCAVEWTLQ